MAADVIYYDVDHSRDYPQAAKHDHLIEEPWRRTQYRVYKESPGGEAVAWYDYQKDHPDYPDAKEWKDA